MGAYDVRGCAPLKNPRSCVVFVCHVPLTYKRGKSCPPYFHLIGEECYKYINKTDFLSAELECTAEANADYVTRLGFPVRHQHQQDLSILAQQEYSAESFFLGLDTSSKNIIFKSPVLTPVTEKDMRG